jgi:hypothetical protein
MPTFTDGTTTTAANLNSLVTGINNLGVLLTGIAATRQIIPVSSMYLNTTLSVPTGADTIVSLPTISINEDNLWVPSVGHMTVQTAGIYIAWAQINWDYNAVGIRAAHMLLNGTSIAANSIAAGSGNTNATAGTGTAFLMISPILSLAVGAQIYLSVFQNSGGALNLIPNESGTSLSLIRVGA